MSVSFFNLYKYVSKRLVLSYELFRAILRGFKRIRVLIVIRYDT